MNNNKIKSLLRELLLIPHIAADDDDDDEITWRASECVCGSKCERKSSAHETQIYVFIIIIAC